MKKYDVTGIGNALVDIEFKVTDQFFWDNKVEKGLMTWWMRRGKMHL
jgi:hypothetical protein